MNWAGGCDGSRQCPGCLPGGERVRCCFRDLLRVLFGPSRSTLVSRLLRTLLASSGLLDHSSIHLFDPEYADCVRFGLLDDPLIEGAKASVLVPHGADVIRSTVVVD